MAKKKKEKFLLNFQPFSFDTRQQVNIFFLLTVYMLVDSSPFCALNGLFFFSFITLRCLSIID